jgi:Nuclease-related domain
MPESITSLLQQQGLDPALIYPAAGLALLVLLALVFRHRIALWRENRQIAGVVRRLGPRSKAGLHLPDGTGGEVTLDYLVLTRDCLLVVGIKRFSGLIFGGPNMDQWTQVIKRVSYKFPNPDEYLLRQINAVRAMVPGIDVRGVHLFTHSAQFSRDKPANVLSTRDLKQLPERPRLKEIPAALRQAWEQLYNTKA